MPKILANLAILLALCGSCVAQEAQLPALFEIGTDLTSRRLEQPSLCGNASLPKDKASEISQLVSSVSQPGAKDALGNSPAYYAVMADNPSQLDRLLSLGYDTTVPEGSLLHAAAFWNSVDSANRLLDIGVDPNVQNKGGGTPLMVAVSEGGPDVARLLLARGARVDTKTLRHAITCRDQSIVDLLVKHGARVDADTRRIANKFGVQLRADGR
ncbi:ankyrin repeat domain-containing protein [Lysobacter fragariae]